MDTAPSSGGALADALRSTIRDVPDFPTPGILFKDITTVLLAPELFRETTRAMGAPFERERITHVVAIESRGFLLAAPVAQQLGAALVPVRKPGKLPHVRERVEYALEYGTDALEMHRDALGAGNRVLIVDDVLATGGTAGATCQLVERLGGHVVGFSFMIALTFLPGLEALAGRRVEALIRY